MDTVIVPVMNRLEIEISDVVGESAVTPEDGHRIYERIHPVLREGRAVLLNFTGVRVLAPPFLKTAVGRLLEDIPYDEIIRCLGTRGLSRQDAELLERVIVTAREYYGEPEARHAMDQANPNASKDD